MTRLQRASAFGWPRCTEPNSDSTRARLVGRSAADRPSPTNGWRQTPPPSSLWTRPTRPYLRRELTEGDSHERPVVSRSGAGAVASGVELHRRDPEIQHLPRPEHTHRHRAADEFAGH